MKAVSLSTWKRFSVAAVVAALLIVSLFMVLIPNTVASGVSTIDGSRTINRTHSPVAATDDLIITAVFDGPLSGGIPKGIELYVVNNISDLSIYGLGSANNGGGTDGEEFTFPADSAIAGGFIYVASEAVGFESFFGFAPDYTSGSAAGINGDDAVELFTNGSVSDIFGDINTDGTGEPWDHLDGWAYRNDETGPDGTTFVLSNWSFSGPNALDGETTNAAAVTPVPIGTYMPTSGVGSFAIGKSAPPLVFSGELFTYTITITNNTGITTTGTVITDVVPTDTTFASASDGGIESGGVVSWTIAGDFVAGASIERTFVVTATTSLGTDIVNADYGVSATEWVTMAYGSPVTRTVVPLDLSITKTGSTYSSIGRDIVYAVTIDNQGVTNAENVVVTDTLPISTTFVSSDMGVAATPALGVYVWNLGTILSDTVQTYYITATVNAGISDGTLLTNTIEIMTSISGDDLSNNTDTWQTSVYPIVAIHDIQGNGPDVTAPGTTVIVEGVVVGDYQGSDELRGFFIQEETTNEDADIATSEGIFVYCDACSVDVAEGNIVEVVGVQEDRFGMSQLSVPDAVGGSVVVKDAGNNMGLVTAASIDLPVPASFTNVDDYYEQFEGMLVEFVDELTVTEYFELARFGHMILSEGGKLRQFTHTDTPDAAGFTAHQDEMARRRIILDDLNNAQNVPLVYHPLPGGFSFSNVIRGGDTVNNLTGVLDYSYPGSGSNTFRIRPQQTNIISFADSNPREAAPTAVSGDITVASFNVLNYFTTIDIGTNICGPLADDGCRGAHSAAELTRQTDKIVAAMAIMDVDVIGLMEIENDASSNAIAALVSALNTEIGAGTTYTYVNTGPIGGDAIKVGIIYKPSVVTPIGVHAVLETTAFTDPNNTGEDKNRPALAQTFQVSDMGNDSVDGSFTVVVNHLKSKGSGCTGDLLDNDTTTGQGNCNLTRTMAAAELVSWLATDPTDTLTNLGAVDTDRLIIGDLNAYKMEDPVTAITDAGYTDVINKFEGANAYSYVFSGEWGYLDHALSSQTLTPQVVSVSEWHINSDEVNLLDYNDAIIDPGEASYEGKPPANPLYVPDSYRASDHDPLIVGLKLSPIAFTTPVDNQEFVAMNNITATVPITVSTPGFTITSDGHWHLYVDSSLVGPVLGYTTTVELSLGQHTIEAVLVDVAHQPLGPTDIVTFTVRAWQDKIIYMPFIIK